MKDILDLSDGWQEKLSTAYVDNAVFTRYQAVHATMLFMAGQLSAAECNVWADFILSSDRVSLEPSRAYELSEFLHAWASTGTIVIDRDSVEVWQSRFAHD